MLELIVLAQLAIIDCVPNHPGGATRPPGWAWRTVENRQCWYEGPVMLPRERLRWAPPEGLPRPFQEPPAFITDHQQFPAPPPPTEFELRWRGE